MQQQSPVNNIPRVAIVILNWNGRDDTLECLGSVFRIDYPSFEVIVVDNGSNDGSVPVIRKTFPQAYLIETGKNLGYAGGNNVGIRYALNRGVDFVFILNNDTIVSPDILIRMVDAAQKLPRAAALGPVVYDHAHPTIISTAGEYFDPNIHCINFKQGEPESSLPSKTTCYEADWITGAAIFIRADILDKIGLLDERYFLVYEESDWCFRAKNHGYACFIVPDAKVWHKVAASFSGEGSPLRLYFSTRNRLLFIEKNFPKQQWIKQTIKSFKIFIPRILPPKPGKAGLAKRLYWSARDTYLLYKNPENRARMLGVIDYLKRRFGDCPSEIRMLNTKWNKTKQRPVDTHPNYSKEAFTSSGG